MTEDAAPVVIVLGLALALFVIRFGVGFARAAVRTTRERMDQQRRRRAELREAVEHSLAWKLAKHPDATNAEIVAMVRDAIVKAEIRDRAVYDLLTLDTVARLRREPIRPQAQFVKLIFPRIG